MKPSIDARASDVKFQLAGGSQPLILVPVFVNGRGPYSFVLDSGAGICLLTAALAAAANVPPTDRKEGRGAGGSVSIELGTLKSLAVGEVAAEDLQVGITAEIEKLARIVGAPIDGVLGFNFLHRYQLTLNYRVNSLIINEPTGASASAYAVPFRLAGPAKPLIVVDVLLNGIGPYQFGVDTGASTTLLSSQVAADLSIAGEPMPAITGAGGSFDATVAHIDSLLVGKVRTTDVAVAVTGVTQMLSEAVGTRLDGVLGYNVLSRYKVCIDYPNLQFTLAPAS